MLVEVPPALAVSPIVAWKVAVKSRAVNAALDWLRRELVRAQNGAVAPVRRTGVMQ